MSVSLLSTPKKDQSLRKKSIQVQFSDINLKKIDEIE